MASVALSTKAIGSIIKLKENGVAVDYLVVHQGKPSNIYDASCDGTWLLRKDLAESRQWHSSAVNKLESSDIHSYLNSTYLSKFDADIQSQIKQVKIPYRQNGGSGGTDRNGANGLSCKIFLLSGYEVGWTTSTNQYFPVDGAVLSYFQGTAATDAKRIGYLNGTATYWWLRSPSTSNTNVVWLVLTNGNCNYYNAFNTYGVRPALVLPSSLLVSDDGSVTTNTAPTTPGSITIPATIKGGDTITINWTAASDAEGNLEGYIVERSVDGGTSWSQIFQGSSLSTTNTVPAGTSTVAYRVKAYDTDGLSSGYKTSSVVAVINNAPPSAPSSITVPNEVKGGSTLTVTWGAATDSDGNLSGYSLERQVDSGTWTQVYTGSGLSFTDTITKGWNTVAYRVRAYDSYNEYGSYTTSDTRTVNNNTAPTIESDYADGADIGAKNVPFSIAYTVDDVDGDTVTVTETLDGTTKRTYTADLGNPASLDLSGNDYKSIVNGNHSIGISASDGKETTAFSLRFSKSVTSCSVTLVEPMDADDRITICVLSVIGSIPSDARYKVEVTNNAKDPTPVWEDCTEEVRHGGNYVFTNQSASNGFSFNFRLTAARGPSGVGGYIISVQGGFQ